MHPIDNDRSIHFDENLDSENAKELLEKIIELVNENEKKWIHLFINSNGGSVSDTLGLYERLMKVIKPNLQTIVVGEANSMAAILFLAGKHRIIGSYATILLHEIGSIYKEEKRLTRTMMETELKELERSEKFYAEIIAQRTNGKVNEKMALDLMRRTTVLSAQQAVELGFAHEILK